MSEPAPVPTSLRLSVWLLAVQAAALGLVALYLLYDALVGAAQTVQSAVAVISYVALAAAALGGLAYALHRRRGWARGPAIVLEMFGILLGYTFVRYGSLVVGVPALLSALGGTVALLAPSTRLALPGRNNS
jgi:hypothetical protein